MRMKSLAAALIGISLLSCANPFDDSSDKQTRTPGKLVGISGTASKSLFLGKVELPTAAQGAAKETAESGKMYLTTLAYRSLTGVPTPVTFEDSYSNKVALEIETVKQLGASTLAVRYTKTVFIDPETGTSAPAEYNGGTKCCLIDFAADKIYALDAYYNIKDSLYSDGTIFIVKNWDTVYKIDASAPDTAIPLTNPAFNPMNGIRFVLGDKLIVSGYAVDIAGVMPPKAIYDVTLEGYSDQEINSRSNQNCVFVMDAQGRLWGLWAKPDKIVYYPIEYDNDAGMVIPRIDGIQDVREFVPAASLALPLLWGNLKTGTLTSGNVYYESDFIIFSEDCCVKVSLNPAGGLAFHSAATNYTLTEAPMSSFYYYYVLLADAMYWIAPGKTKIFRMDWMTGIQSVEYEAANLANQAFAPKPLLAATGGDLLFYAYASATMVYSYSLLPGTGAPVRTATHQMEVENFVELEF